MKLIKLFLPTAFLFMLYPVYAQTEFNCCPCICGDKPPEICQEILKLQKEKISETKRFYWNQRLSAAYNVSRTNLPVEWNGSGGSHFEDMSGYAYGIAVQYHFLGIHISDSSWRGNPLFGLNLFLDGTLVNNKSSQGTLRLGLAGFGLELQFLYVFRAAAGLSFVYYDEITIHGSGSAPARLTNGWERILFLQGGISIPVYDRYDVFVLADFRSNYENTQYEFSKLPTFDIVSYRAGIGYRFGY